MKRRLSNLSVLLICLASLPLAVVLITAALQRIFESKTADEYPADIPVSSDVAVQTPAVTETSDATPAIEDNTDLTPEVTPQPTYGQTPLPPPGQTPQPTPEPILVISIPDNDPILAAQLDLTASKYDCVAVSMAVYDSEGIFYTYQYGMANISEHRPVDIDTKFRVASLSKIVPAICALSLFEAGIIDIDDDISVYLGYTVRNPDYPNTPITAKMLMQHTSSIYDSTDFSNSRSRQSTGKSTKDLLDSGTSFRSRRPGAGFQYSNFATSVLGAVCESASGKLMDTLADEILFTPLGIDAAFSPVLLRDTENIAAIYNSNHKVSRSVHVQLDTMSSGEIGRDHHLVQGNLTISALDYAKILAMLCNGGVFNGERILSEETVNLMHTADIKGAAYMQGLSVRLGEGAFEGDDVYWHTGSAYGEFTQFIYSIEKGRAVVVLTTGCEGKRRGNGMVEVCCEMTKPVW